MKSQSTRAAELETLATFRDFIDEFCLLSGVGDDACHDIKLAVDEACTNVVTHGYAGMNLGSIMLALEFEPQLVQSKSQTLVIPSSPRSRSRRTPKLG